MHDSLFTSLQNEVHSDANIIIYYSCYYVFCELHSVRPCKGMYIQKFVKGAVETSWLKCNIFLPVLWMCPVQTSNETPITLTESSLLFLAPPQQCWVITFKYVTTASRYSFSNSLFTNIHLFSTVKFELLTVTLVNNK